MKDLNEATSIKLIVQGKEQDQAVSLVLPIKDGPLTAESFRQGVEQLAEMVLIRLDEVPALVDADGTAKPNQKFVEKYGEPKRS